MKLSSIVFTICFSFYFLPQILFSDHVSMVQVIPLGSQEKIPSAPSEKSATFVSPISQIELTAVAPFSNSQITIFSDGYVRYETDSPGNNISEDKSKRLTAEEFDGLAQLVSSSRFDTLEREYRDPEIADATAFTVTVYYTEGHPSASSHSVTCYAVCPLEVDQIITSIKQLWGSEVLEIGL